VRQRRPGVWEVRVALGPDPVTGVSRRRSITVHGNEAVAEEARRRCAEEADRLRARFGLSPGVTVGALLTAWLAADHGWRPSTISGFRSIVRFLTRDRIAGRRAVEASSSSPSRRVGVAVSPSQNCAPIRMTERGQQRSAESAGQGHAPAV
jgi:hypothetical protein